MEKKRKKTGQNGEKEGLKSNIYLPFRELLRVPAFTNLASSISVTGKLEMDLM